MDGRTVIENLDSLWFFGTVFSVATTAPVPAIIELENPTVNDVGGEEMATPISENQENERPVGEDYGFGSEMKTEAEITPKEEKRGSRSRIKRRPSCSCLRQRRKVLGEMDLRFAVKEISECWLFEEQRIGGENYQKKKMPPFEDSMAMKEHIRSWAYAVACTVR